MKFIPPVLVTPAMISASNVAEADYPRWSSSTTYNTGDRVIERATHRIYESAIDANTGHDPAAGTGEWSNVGPTNAWAMFDQAAGAMTVQAGTLTVSLVPGQAIGALVLLDIDAASAQVKVTVGGTQVYSKTQSTTAGGAQASVLTFTDLPANAGATISVSVAPGASGSAKVGKLIIGNVVDLGTTETNATIALTDYSVRQTDDYGVTTVVKRSWAKKITARTQVATSTVDAVQQTLALVRAKAVLWIGDDAFTSLTTYGFYSDFSADFQLSDVSYCSLTIEGLPSPDLDLPSFGLTPGDSLKVIEPGTVTDAVLTSSSVAETDYPVWSSGTTYADGARVIKTATHRIYESTIASNQGNDPAAAESTAWVDVGPTNRWAMFDQALGSYTTATGQIAVTLTPGTDVAALAVLDTTAATVRVQAPGYDETKSTTVGGATVTDLSFLDLAVAAGNPITVTLSGASGTASVSVGTLVLGSLSGLGTTENSPTIAITDYSTKTTDDFGSTVPVERAWAKHMVARSLISTSAVDSVLRLVASIRATPSLWIGQDGVDSLTIYGFFRDFSIELAANVSICSWTIEGLSTAASVPVPAPTTVNWSDIIDDNGGLAQLIAEVDGAGQAAAAAGDAIEALADDSVLTVTEKVQVLIPQDAALEAAWTTILSLATSLGITTELTAATAARSAWQTYRNGLTPAWNSTAADTPVVRATFRDKLSSYDYDLKDLQRAVSAKIQANLALGMNPDGTIKTGRVTPDSFATGLVVIQSVSTLPASGADGILYKTPDGKLYAWVGGKWVSSQAPVAVALTSDGCLVPTAADRSSPDLSRANGQALVYLGVTDVTASATFSAAGTNCTGTVNTADNTPVAGKPRGYFQVTGISADAASFAITVTSNGVTQTKTFTLARSPAGAAGADGTPGASAFTLADVSNGNTTCTSNTITKTGGSGSAFDASAVTIEGFAGGAFAGFQAVDATHSIIIGLNSDPQTATDTSDIDFGINLTASGTLSIYESGTVVVANAGTYVAGDRFLITYDNSEVIYRQNGNVLRTATGVASGRMFFLDSSFKQLGGSVKSVTFGSVGAIGASAATLTLGATAPAFTFDGTGAASPVSQSIVLTANLQNVSGAASWTATAFAPDGTTSTVTLGGTTPNVRTLSLAAFGAAQRVVITASIGSLRDTTTIVRLQAGSDALTALLSNEAATIPAAADGTVPNGGLSAASGTFRVFRGAVEVTSQCSFQVTSQIGCTAAITSAGAYSVSAMSANAAVVTLHATYQGVVLEKALTLAKSIAGAPGADAPLLSLKASSLTFTFDGNGNQVPSNQSVVVTPVLQNATGSASWTVRRTYDDGSSLAYPYTTNGDGSIAIEPDTLGSAINVKVSATLGTLTDQLTIVKLSGGANGVDGDPVIVPDLTNENVTVPADKNGTVPSGGFGAAAGSFKLYKGLTDISTGNGVAYSVVNPSGVTMTIDAASGAYSVSAMSASSGTATLRATYQGKTYDQVFTISKSIAGQDGTNGASASVLTLTPSNNFFTFDSTGAASPAAQSISFTAKLQNLTGTPTFTATKFSATGAVLGTATLGGSGLTRTLAVADFANAASVLVTATLGAYSDNEQVVRVQAAADGQTPIVGVLTNEATTLPAATNGTVTAAALASAGGTFRVFFGLTEVTSQSAFTLVSSSGCTATIDASSGAYSVSAMSADAASFELHATYQGVTIDKVVSLAKSRAGANGTNGVDGITAYLTQPAIQIPCFPDGTLAPGALANAGGNFLVKRSGTDLTGSCAFSVVSLTNCNVTLSSSGAYAVQSITADSAQAVFRAAYGGTNYDLTLSITRSKAGNAAYVRRQSGSNSAGAVTTYFVVNEYDTFPVDTGTPVLATGQITYTAATGTYGVQAKLQYRLNGGAWTDVSGSETTGGLAGADGEPAQCACSGTISAATLGSAASVDIRLMMRRASGTGTASIGWQQSMSWSI